MKKRIFFAIVLPMLMICILSPAFLVHQAKAIEAGPGTLADAINSCSVNWSIPDFFTFRTGVIFNALPLSSYDTYIQQYASNQDWSFVLRIARLAEEDGYSSSTIDTATQQAISNMSMLLHLPQTETYARGAWYGVYDRFILNGYRYASQYGQTSKWNESAAYQELLATYQATGVALGYNPITKTAYTQYPRYYDESAETLDSFFELGGNDAGLWDYIQNNFWTGTMYGYAIGDLQYECEVGFFALVIGNYYVASGRTVPNFDRVYLDLYNKLLVDGWNSVAWGVPGVLKHASSNPQLRLENTLGAVQALQAFSGSSNWRSSWVNLLTGSGGSTPAWQALIASPLYSNGQFYEYSVPLALDMEDGMLTLFLEGIIPNTGSLAMPLNDEGYQYAIVSGLPSSLFQFDYANKRIRIPVNPGEIKFQYGTGIASYVFPSAGVYEVQFDNSWNTVTGASLVEPLPSLFQYLQGNISSPPTPNPPLASFDWSPSSPVTGEPVTFDASSSLPGWNGTNTMPIALYSWDFGDGNTSAGQIVTHEYLELGNYTVSLNVTDSEGLWNVTAQQIQVAVPLPLFVSIGPSSSAIPIGQSIIFTSTVNGGVIPYSYQWYLSGNPVSGATNSTWTFSPTSAGSQTVYVAVTDNAAIPASAQSNNASVTAAEGVYVMSDGSVVPSSAPISSLDNVTYTFTGNISYPTYYGVVVERSNITIDGNGFTVQGNSQTRTGISLTDISNVTIKSTNIDGFQYGIQLYSSNNNTIIENNATANTQCGIDLDSSSNNNIIANNIANNSIGLQIQSASNNTIYHNNFIANNAQTYIDSTSLGNAWNDTYPSGGNYWSNYAGGDLYSGSYQNEAGSDGIGDTPYTVDANNTDHYPLMKPYPWSPHDIGITSVAVSKTMVGQGFTLSVNVIVFNYGINTEYSNVTAYANGTSISTFENVLIESRNSTTITLTWNTTGFAYGNYTISAYAWPVPGESNTADNSLAGGTVYIGIPGDLNGDGTVNTLDAIKLGNAFLTTPGSKNWNPNADINGDGIINILDAIILDANFLRHYP
jgi:parallel beta-helix repeat protein